jgi:hypothetical protein
MTRSLQGFLEKMLGRRRVSLRGKPEVDRGAGGIDGTVQVAPFPTLSIAKTASAAMSLRCHAFITVMQTA